MQSKKESVQAMTNMLKRILVMTQALQPISEPPQLTMKIFYYDNVTPHDYEPPNFRKGLPTDYDKEDLKTECFELGTVDSNHHKVALKVRTTVQLDVSEEVTDEEEQQEDIEFPAEILVPSSPTFTPPTSHNLANQDDDVFVEPSTNNTTVAPLSQVSNLTNVLALLQNQLPLSDVSNPHLEIDCNSRNGTQSTQVRSFSPDRVSETPELEFPNEHDPLQETSSQFVRRSTRQRESLDSQQPLITPETHVSVPADEEQEQMLGCPCRSVIVDTPLIQCVHCKIWNHPNCCGYLTENDRRIPRAGHCCYTCANIHYHPNAYDMEVVGNVTIIRRGLVLAWDLGGVESINSFGTTLGVSIGVAKQVVEVLKRDGFFKEVKRAKNKSQSMMYSFVTAKRQSPQFKYWMSDASLPMAPIPDVDADLSEEEDEFEESQVILGRPIVSSGFSTRTPPATVGRIQDQVQRMDFEGGVSGLVLDRTTSIQQVSQATTVLVNSQEILVADSMSDSGGLASKRGRDDVVDIDADDDLTQDDQAITQENWRSNSQEWYAARGVGSQKRGKMSVGVRSQEY